MAQQNKQDREKTWQMLEHVIKQIEQLRLRTSHRDLATNIPSGSRERIQDRSSDRPEIECDHVDTLVQMQNLSRIEVPNPHGLSNQQHFDEFDLTQKVVSELATTFAELNADQVPVEIREKEDIWELVKLKMFTDFHFVGPDHHRGSLSAGDQDSDSTITGESDEAKSLELDNLLGITRELPDEIDSLRKELEEKLRKAEIELSIQRARISNQQAKLEERHLWLEQREREIQKATAVAGENCRWTRHIPAPRKPAE